MPGRIGLSALEQTMDMVLGLLIPALLCDQRVRELLRKIYPIVIEFLRYTGWELGETAIFYAVQYWLKEIVGWEYIVAATIAFVSTVIPDFWVQRRWVFENTDRKGKGRQFYLFLRKETLLFLLSTLPTQMAVTCCAAWYAQIQVPLKTVVGIGNFLWSRRILHRHN